MIPQVGERWVHFKGTVYVVRCLARHSEQSKEVMVIYSTAKDPLDCWARPISSWLEWVHDRPLTESIAGSDPRTYSGPRFYPALNQNELLNVADFPMVPPK